MDALGERVMMLGLFAGQPVVVVGERAGRVDQHLLGEGKSISEHGSRTPRPAGLETRV